MDDSMITGVPQNHKKILKKSQETGFTMPSDLYVGSLLKTLAAAKPSGHFLELGTGLGLSLSWIVDGMDENSKAISVDNDPKLSDFARECFAEDHRTKIVCLDGNKWILENSDERFDLIFADAWPGKFDLLDETLAMIKKGGFYVIDDLDVQSNWPEGHAAKVVDLIDSLEKRTDIVLTKFNWSTGLILATKK